MAFLALWLICVTVVAVGVILGWNRIAGLVQHELPLTDEEMYQATTHARQTVQDFIEALSNPGADMQMFSVRVPVRYREILEYLWIENPVYDGQGFVGTLSADSVEVPGYQKGRKVRIAREHICDWMYVKDSRLVGGYTIRLHYARQPGGVKKSLRDQYPFDIDAEIA